SINRGNFGRIQSAIPQCNFLDAALEESPGEDGALADGENILLSRFSTAFVRGYRLSIPVNHSGMRGSVECDDNHVPLIHQRSSWRRIGNVAARSRKELERIVGLEL